MDKIDKAIKEIGKSNRKMDQELIFEALQEANKTIEELSLNSYDLHEEAETIQIKQYDKNGYVVAQSTTILPNQ